MKSGACFCMALLISSAVGSSALARKDGGVVSYPGRTAGGAVFSHAAHKKAAEDCETCHQSGSPGRFKVAMDEIRNGGACGKCHKAASSSEECTRCHMPMKDIIYRLNRMDPVAFSHIRHLSMDPTKRSSIRSGFSCRDCHPTPFARNSGGQLGMPPPHETAACAQCHDGGEHNGRTIFAANTRCLTCHRGAH